MEILDVNYTNNGSLQGNLIEYPLLILWHTVSSLVPIVSALLSFMLVIALLTGGAKRDGTTILIIQLLLHEIILLIPVFLFNTHIYFVQTSRTFPTGCTAITASRYLLYTVGHWLHVCLALNRFIAILFPHSYQLCSNKKALTVMIVLSWGMGLTTTVPFLTTSQDGHYGLLSGAGVCGLASHKTIGFSLLTHLRISAPLALQGLLYGCVLVTLMRKTCRSERISPLGPARNTRKQNDMAVVLLVFFLWHTICFLPLPLITAYVPSFWTGRDLLFLWICSLLLFGSVGTPVILIVLSSEYRRAVTKSLSRFLLFMQQKLGAGDTRTVPFSVGQSTLSGQVHSQPFGKIK